jgi:hypothetical protein
VLGSTERTDAAMENIRKKSNARKERSAMDGLTKWNEGKAIQGFLEKHNAEKWKG